MRHRRAVKKLGRTTSGKKALLRSLVTNLILRERIFTTYAKARQASSLADKLITLGKRNTITSKKTAISILGSKYYINILFDDIAPRFSNRMGGYSRVMQLAPRKGDGAKMAILELTERKPVVKPEKKSQREKKETLAKDEKRQEKKKVLPDEKDRSRKKPAGPPIEKVPSAPAPPEVTPISAKEKIDEEKRREKAKSEKEKLQKGFFKGLRRYFRGRAG